MKWLLDSNRRYFALCFSQVQYPYNAFVHSIPSCFNKCIITTIRLSGLSWRTKTTLAPLASRLIPLVLSFTCNPVTYNQADTLCVLQSTSYSFASTISTCCSHGLGTMNATLLPTIYHVSVGSPSS